MPSTPGWQTPAVGRRQFLIGSSAALAAVWLAACSGGSNGSSASGSSLAPPPLKIDGDLDYYAPTGYVPDELLAAFEAEYGVKINQTNFATVDEMIQKLGAGATYDITFLPSNFFARATSANLLLPIDHSVMQNWSQVTPLFQNPPFEPNATHLAAPYAMGGVGLAYRKSEVSGLTGSWNDLWNISPTIPGLSYIFDDVTVSMTMALARLGLPTNTSSTDDLNAAADSLIELKKSLGGFASSAGEKLTDGQALLLMNYTGATYQSLQTSEFADDIDFEFCSETMSFNSDCVVVPAAAKHPGTGLVFADFLLRPDNMTKIVDFVGYPVSTTAGNEAYNTLVADYPFLQYDEAVLTNPNVWLASLQGEQLQAWNQAWSRVKAS
jgi:spermidine/putrescine transport system substrate-binding protein